MKDPKDFPKSLCMLQGFEIVFYTVASAVIYRYAGQNVTSPALGSAGIIVRKVAYGIAIPTIVIAGVVLGHVAIKNVYVRLFRGTDVMHKRSALGVGAWIGLAAGYWIIAWVIAEAIPVFSDLVSLVSALFASWFSCEYSIHCRYLLGPHELVANELSSRSARCLLAVHVLGQLLHLCPQNAPYPRQLGLVRHWRHHLCLWSLGLRTLDLQ